jgi:hypothetical protein
VQPDQEETKEEAPIEVKYPIEMTYCGKCGLPPEYCEFGGKASDLEECKKWLE